MTTTNPLVGYQTEADFKRTVIDRALWCKWTPYSIPDSRRASATGFPDLVLMHESGALLAVELKLDHTYPTRAQRRWLAAFEQYGIPAYIWRPRDWESGVIERTLKGIDQ